MSVSTIVVRGYGQFSEVKYLPTLGYTAAVETPPGVIGIDLALNARRTEYCLNNSHVEYEVKEE